MCIASPKHAGDFPPLVYNYRAADTARDVKRRGEYLCVVRFGPLSAKKWDRRTVYVIANLRFLVFQEARMSTSNATNGSDVNSNTSGTANPVFIGTDNRCCFCLTLRTGSVIVGVVNALVSTLLFSW